MRKEEYIMDWYWLAGIAAIIAGLYYWFYVR